MYTTRWNQKIKCWREKNKFLIKKFIIRNLIKHLQKASTKNIPDYMIDSPWALNLLRFCVELVLPKKPKSIYHKKPNIIYDQDKIELFLLVSLRLKSKHEIKLLLLQKVLEWKFHNFCNEMVGRVDLMKRWKIHITSKWSRKNPFPIERPPLTYSIFHYPWLRLFSKLKMCFHHNWSQDIEQFWLNF